MKYLLMASFALSLNAIAQHSGGNANESIQATTRGTDISGAGTMGTQEYPNSGSTKNQSSDVTGNDAGSGVQLSGSQNNSMTEKRNGEESFDETLDRGSTQTGPYNTSDEMQAEQAKSGRDIELDSEQEKKRKQQGE